MSDQRFMNALSNRGDRRSRYGEQLDLLAGHEAEVVNAIRNVFGSQENFINYLNTVQPSRNVEYAPPAYTQPMYQPTRREWDQGYREFQDRENTSPLYRPEADNMQDVRSWMYDLLNKRGAR